MPLAGLLQTPNSKGTYAVLLLGGDHGSELPFLSLRCSEHPWALCLKQVVVCGVWCVVWAKGSMAGWYLPRHSICQFDRQTMVPLWKMQSSEHSGKATI